MRPGETAEPDTYFATGSNALTGDACVAQTKSKRPNLTFGDRARQGSGGGTRSEQSEDELSTAKPGEEPS